MSEPVEPEACGTVTFVCGSCGDTEDTSDALFVNGRCSHLRLPDGWTCRRPMRGALIGDAILCPDCKQRPKRKSHVASHCDTQDE